MARLAVEKPPVRRTPSPSPARAKPKQPKAVASKRNKDYGSEGVEDNDVFLLPGSDYQLLLGITLISTAVRLFKIYQPSSVVFDEVQYATEPLPHLSRELAITDRAAATASAVSLPSTSKANSSWTFTPRWPSL